MRRDYVDSPRASEVGPARPFSLPSRGKDLKLTIDIDRAAARRSWRIEGDANGAVVAMDPRNGEILAHGHRTAELSTRMQFSVRLTNRAIGLE